jgi:hypothetical protein
MNIAFTLLLLLQLPVGATSQAGAIAGRVRTSQGGPAVEVRVAATPVEAGNTTDGAPTLLSIGQTDSEGRYRLENIPPGNYYVLAGLLDRPTYYPAAVQPSAARVVKVAAGATTQGVDFSLVRSAGVSVKGRVVRADGSTTTRQQLYMNPTSGGVYKPFNVEVASDSSFAFTRVPPGNYNIVLSPGFPGAKPFLITVGEIDVEGLEFFVPRVRMVSGEIIINDGSPLPRLSLSFIGSDATIPGNLGNGGAFRINLPEGDYRILLSGFPFGYTGESITHGSTDLSRAMLHVGATDVSGVRISLKAPPAEAWLKVRGIIERPLGSGTATNKMVLRGSQVLQDMEASIGADGVFQFPKVLPGTYTLQPQPFSGILTPVTINVNRDIDDLKIVLPRQFEITGRITVEDGAPTPYLGVTATGKDGVAFASTEPGGRFKFVLNEGEHRIAIQTLPPGYVLKSIMQGATNLQIEPLRASGTNVAEMVVTLAPSSPNLWKKISGKVAAPPGLVSLNTLRVGLNGSGINIEVPVNDDGAFEFSKVAPGSYTVRLIPGSGIPPATITVADQNVGGIVLQIPNRIPVSGRITMETTVPLPRAAILVDGETQIDLGAVQPDGSFTVRLPEGEHRLLIAPSSPGYRVKSLAFGSVNVLQRPAVIKPADPQQLLIEFEAESPGAWKKVSGRLRASPDAALPSNRLLVAGPGIQNLEIPLAADGSFELPKLAAGNYGVFLQPVGLYSPSAEFVVADSDVTGIELAPPEVIRIPAVVSIENGGSPPSKTTVFRAQTVRQIRGLMGMVESVGDDEDLSLRLVAGEYRVTTVRLPAGFSVQSMTYGATDLLRDPLQVNGPGNTRIEVVLRRFDPASISGVRVSGRVKMPPAAGTPRPTTVAFSATLAGGQTFETPINDDGSFLFPKLPPGSYDSRLLGPDIPTSIQQYRKQVVVTSSDQEGVELTAVIFAPVRGRVVLDGPGSLPDFRSRSLGVMFRQSSFAIGDAVRPDGSFEMALVRGDYQVALDIPEPYYIKSIFSGGADLVQGRFTHDASEPREIVITLGIRGGTAR